MDYRTNVDNALYREIIRLKINIGDGSVFQMLIKKANSVIRNWLKNL